MVHPEFEQRKRDHLRHALDPQNEATGLTGLDKIRLRHEALPELDFETLSLRTHTLERSLPTPFYVCGMTAGHRDAPELNRVLAEACAERGWAMGVGSQRRQLTDPNSEAIDQWLSIRERTPDLFILGNLGISQLIQTSSEGVRSLAHSLGAAAMAIHTNALQECLQPEGTPHFKGGMKALERLCKELTIPVVLKETGCGFSSATLRRLAELRLGAVDVSGLGGTHWGRIEGKRAEQVSNDPLAQAAETFRDWGHSTVTSVLDARQALSQSTEVWASGGVRSGLDAAKLIALGAQMVGYAKPALEMALESKEALLNWMAQQEFELKVALFCTGCESVEALRGREELWSTHQI